MSRGAFASSRGLRRLSLGASPGATLRLAAGALSGLSDVEHLRVTGPLAALRIDADAFSDLRDVHLFEVNDAPLPTLTQGMFRCVSREV